MNKQLLTTIKNAIVSAVSGTTKQVYFDHLPDAKLLKEITVVYELKNTDNLSTFDIKELGKTYDLTIKMNSPDVSFGSLSIYNLKDRIYKLEADHIRLIDDLDLFFDPQLEVWTQYLRFRIQVSK